MHVCVALKVPFEQLSSGACFGKNYQGSCEALFHPQRFSTQDKKDWEFRCCTYWPKLVEEPAAREAKLEQLEKPSSRSRSRWSSGRGCQPHSEGRVDQSIFEE
ncbi:unnamed protein product [Vitrella brassicaformis CCMP3155]|uniref:CPW-WPC domain-containing protein n=1 Tax=Vitrella brassicaformis (strain CCMP3155) TaxID=1169540 RepID=A0A0G4F2D6_VITBC|nr:unnamed protein product [Vitrella brassicaformis CCMP3155]|eukprot:CEM05535.1 unnamed protein product [Vitrella brassicaformis CCMP3155]